MSQSTNSKQNTSISTTLINSITHYKIQVLSCWSSIPYQAQYTIVTSATLFSGLYLYKMCQRIQNSDYFTPKTFKKYKKMKGFVTSVGDSDGFRFYHTPWFHSVPGHKVKADQTINIRLAGVDAPELPHFGEPGQPFGAESLKHLKSLILYKEVIIKPYRKDQYGRIVARCQIPYFGGFFKKDVGKDMLKHGMAVVYNQGGAEYGGKESIYRRVEAEAKARKIGVWSNSRFQTPAQYKAKYGKK